MTQSRKLSALEKLSDQAAGFIMAYLLWRFVITTMIEHDILKLDDSLIITFIFAVMSFARGYGFRRLFNYLGTKKYWNKS